MCSELISPVLSVKKASLVEWRRPMQSKEA